MVLLIGLFKFVVIILVNNVLSKVVFELFIFVKKLFNVLLIVFIGILISNIRKLVISKLNIG